MVLGKNMMQFDAFAPWFGTGDAHGAHAVTPVQLANHYGVFGVEMGVAITVTAVMFTLFLEISRPEEQDEK